jgi:formylglycine-generating enzyme required for sulfatase activity
LPDIEWCEVPEGEFLFGRDDEPRWLPAFRIAKYPVTNVQFQAFIDSGAMSSRSGGVTLCRVLPLLGRLA